MSYDSTSHEVADQARMLYSGKEDIQAQPVSWNLLQMDFVLVRSVMKLDNRFQHPESRVKSLLSAVVEMGRVDLAAALLRMGAGVNDRDYTGRTALMVACSSAKAGNWDKIVDMLLQAGADIQARDVNGDTALNYAQR
jgi:ankyrin repeat protein